jgi:hypothetical protein
VKFENVRRLTEIELRQDSFTLFLYDYFRRKLNIDIKLLPSTFISDFVDMVITELLAQDKKFCNDQGFILVLSVGASLRRGATGLQIKAFIDVVIQTCRQKAESIKDNKNLQTYQKTFIQTFSSISSNETWITEIRNSLTSAIAKSKPFYIKVDEFLEGGFY